MAFNSKMRPGRRLTQNFHNPDDKTLWHVLNPCKNEGKKKIEKSKKEWKG